MVTRRDFLKRGGVAAVGLTGGVGVAAGGVASSQDRPAARKAGKVIFLVSDGMSIGTLTMADHFLRHRDGRSSNWVGMYDKYPAIRSLMDMASANSAVTDSAAAASSWGSGQRVPNGHINVDALGRSLEPVFAIAKRNGLKAGLVTTTAVTHATPAGFAANARSRNSQELFASQYLKRDYDIILGGGRAFFEADRREDGLDLLHEFRNSGRSVLFRRDELMVQPAKEAKLLGLFARSHLPYEIDRVNTDNKERCPSLAEMTSAALHSLSASGDGFMLMIEGGRVDHAAHNNDISGLIYDQIAFDDALAVVLDFYENNPDTLIIVTTDHGNASPGLNSGWPLGANTLGKVAHFTRSLSSVADGWEDWPSAGAQAIKDRFFQYLKIELTEAECQLILDRIENRWRAAYHRMNGIHGVIGQIIANHIEVGWVGNSHTSEYVELAALGPGSEKIKPFTRNIELFDVMLRALDIG